MKHNKLLSQVFLKNKYYIEKVVDALDHGRKNILEIGAGEGQISKIIAQKVKFLYCIEIDPRLAKITKNKLADQQNTKIIQADIRDVSLAKLGKKFVVFSNVPYYLSANLLEYLIYYRKNIITNYLILQKEFVNKISAKPGSKSYGFISCLTQYNGKVKRLFDIPAGAFIPSPKVNSSFIEVKFYQRKPIKAKNEDFLFALIKTVFTQRRKKIKTILKQHFSSRAFGSLTNLDLNLDMRPEQISLRDFCKISDCLDDFNNF
ncbi:MAG: 16S rRNA (adenine(1518)-N(6)/adenine(1519)-N(6))-dimethyltransferase RsmA [Candidatus Omnitrophica bacterium]|nr:16S rRNA (adenine(1518)-N(6)/adenine(1519)-N(6))-dimethyltransferase RsmA [Candidatus Omnitrophota bacterium]